LDSGVAMAEAANLTLAGFVRGKRMNIYTFPERILL
jgi:formate dehydrogenase accessory protein FdhD